LVNEGHFSKRITFKLDSIGDPDYQCGKEGKLEAKVGHQRAVGRINGCGDVSNM